MDFPSTPNAKDDWLDTVLPSKSAHVIYTNVRTGTRAGIAKLANGGDRPLATADWLGILTKACDNIASEGRSMLAKARKA